MADLPPDIRWRQKLRQIEVVSSASANLVPQDNLEYVVGRAASVNLLIENLAVDFDSRPYEVAQVSAGWMLRARSAYAPVMRTAADVGSQALHLS